MDLGVRNGLVALLRELVTVNGLRWIRPFYLYPQQVTDELIALYAGEETLAKYIDMPFQHINDAMLKRMHRLGGKADITALVEKFRSRIPGLTFRTAFIRVAGRNGFCTNSKPASGFRFPETRITGTFGNDFPMAWARVNPSPLGIWMSLTIRSTPPASSWTI